jgi:hypothetical protein
MTSSGYERYYVENGIPMCFCGREKIHKPCSGFAISRSSTNGFQNICKECMRKSTSYRRQDDHYENPKDLIIAHELLRNIGYDPDSEISITQQFHTKHNLPQ